MPRPRLFGRLRRGGGGVNVVGYLDDASGLGDRARELVASLRAGGVEVSEWSVGRSGEGETPPPPVHGTTIAVVTAIQMADARARCPLPFERADRVIGYFFWELATVPDEQAWGIGLVDAIWAPTRFVEAAYRAATAKPVVHVPLPLPRPEPSGLAPTATFDVLVSFDLFSVMERKNPIGAIDAFRRAFPADDPASAPMPARLIVKTLHGDERPAQLARLLDAAGDDDRIEVVDRELGHDELVAMIERADVLLSVHRSEGLGLHIAEAMSLGTLVVASRYGGLVDFADDTTAALIDVDLVEVADGEGAYAAPAVWADPDLDQAAALLRRAFVDAEWREATVARARERIESSPTREEIGANLASALR